MCKSVIRLEIHIQLLRMKLTNHNAGMNDVSKTTLFFTMVRFLLVDKTVKLRLPCLRDTSFVFLCNRWYQQQILFISRAENQTWTFSISWRWEPWRPVPRRRTKVRTGVDMAWDTVSTLPLETWHCQTFHFFPSWVVSSRSSLFCHAWLINYFTDYFIR